MNEPSATMGRWNVAGRALWGVALAMVAASWWAAATYAPVEAQMGPVQKIVYVHVPSAIVTLIAGQSITTDGLVRSLRDLGLEARILPTNRRHLSHQ